MLNDEDDEDDATCWVVNVLNSPVVFVCFFGAANTVRCEDFS